MLLFLGMCLVYSNFSLPTMNPQERKLNIPSNFCFSSPFVVCPANAHALLVTPGWQLGLRLQTIKDWRILISSCKNILAFRKMFDYCLLSESKWPTSNDNHGKRTSFHGWKVWLPHKTINKIFEYVIPFSLQSLLVTPVTRRWKAPVKADY